MITQEASSQGPDPAISTLQPPDLWLQNLAELSTLVEW